MDEDALRDMVAELRATLRATRAELSDALNVLAQIEQAVGGKVPSRLRPGDVLGGKLVVEVYPDHWVDDAGVRHAR